MFFDTHCHLDMMVLKEGSQVLLNEHFPVLDKIIDAVRDVGVRGMINIGTNVKVSNNSIMLAKRYHDVFATVGIHPCDCGQNWKEELKSLALFLDQKEENKIVGIGETGLDFYHQPFDKEQQIAAFRAHIELALKYHVPLIIHSREASDEVLRVLQEYVHDGLCGVLHCFSHQAYVAQQVLSWGFYIGIGGYITYPKNNELRDIVKNDIPLDRLLLETDAPFLPPQQFRGKQNSPAYIPLFAHMIADLKSIEHQELGKATTSNVRELFMIEPAE